MSKAIKQMQMNALKKDFDGVREMVLLNIVGLGAIPENQMRLSLRKKGIRLQMVKNSLAQRVFADFGLKVTTGWAGPTTIAFGGTSAAELAKEVEAIVKKNDKKMKVKIGVADGLEVAFDIMLKMPTRAEALSRVASLVLSPASRLSAQITGPAAQVCGQIKGIKDAKKEEAVPPPA
ncbi:MAG: 50S ribosomal protein L10 [Gemmataceae bacterium]|nr:50S ribosomal protein L10 [Gemmataceae bacterium]